MRLCDTTCDFHRLTPLSAVRARAYRITFRTPAILPTTSHACITGWDRQPSIRRYLEPPGRWVWVLAQLECGPAKVQKRVSFRGATFGARGQHGMRTSHGPEEDLGADFDLGPAPNAQEEGPPPLGLTPGPQGRPQSRGSAGGCF